MSGGKKVGKRLTQATLMPISWRETQAEQPVQRAAGDPHHRNTGAGAVVVGDV